MAKNKKEDVTPVVVAAADAKPERKKRERTKAGTFRTEGALDTYQLGLRISLDLKYKILRRFGGEGVPISMAATRALEEITKDVHLTAADLKRIADDEKSNYEKRMASRAERGVITLYTKMDYSRFKKK